SVLLTFQRYLPVPEEPDLVGWWERLYEGCLGCVGVLKSWLNRALADANAHEAVTITCRHRRCQAVCAGCIGCGYGCSGVPLIVTGYGVGVPCPSARIGRVFRV